MSQNKLCFWNVPGTFRTTWHNVINIQTATVSSRLPENQQPGKLSRDTSTLRLLSSRPCGWYHLPQLVCWQGGQGSGRDHPPCPTQWGGLKTISWWTPSLLPASCTAVAKPDLSSGLRELCSLGQFSPGAHLRGVGSLKRVPRFFKLSCCNGGSAPGLFPLQWHMGFRVNVRAFNCGVLRLSWRKSRAGWPENCRLTKLDCVKK